MDIQGQGHEQALSSYSIDYMPMYLYIQRRKKTQGSIIIVIQQNVDSFGNELIVLLFIHMNMCILYTRVASNIRVTCTYVSLNKHSTVVTSYLVKVTILSCIMNQLRQLCYSNQPFYIFFLRLQTKKKKIQS